MRKYKNLKLVHSCLTRIFNVKVTKVFMVNNQIH